MGEHRQEFQRELEAIEAKVIELFAMVAEDLPTATHALLSGNNEALQVLAERDQVIDAFTPKPTNSLTGRSCCRRPSLLTCASCSLCCESCPSSSAPTTSS